MADNVAITAGSGTTIAADDIGAGVLAQRVKPVWGPDGTGNDVDVASGKPLPVQLRSSGGVTMSDATGLLISTTQLSTLGQTTASASQPVVIASDQSAVATKAAAAAWVDGADATFGAKADAKSTATDTTAITAMQVLKQISASVQAPPSQAVTNAGTFAVQSAVAGDTANAASDAGNPVKIGGVGKTANPTAVTDGQRVNGLFDKLGKQVCVGAIRDLKGIQQTQISASTSEITIVTAVASTFLDIYGIILANTGASTTKVTIKDSTAGTTRAIIEVPTLETRGFMLPVDSAIPQATVNNNWTATCGTATTALEVTVFYVKNI